jgi:hypothetical protein
MPNVGIVLDIIKRTSGPPVRGKLSSRAAGLLLNLSSSAAAGGFSSLIVRISGSYP